MRTVLAMIAISFALAAPVQAADGRISPATLKTLGLGTMQLMTDDQGAEVRGMSSNALAMGTSLVSGLLIDPATKSFLFGASADAAMSSAENGGLQALSQATSQNASSVQLNLTVTTATSTFSGVLVGGAGGSASASAQ